ncbi:MAG: CoA ester lyase [Alphaproteobacteria bacterium]|nr:CoA ester lyase [Alphaproteobacteria bacterium]
MPGLRPEMYAKAAATGADHVCVDLEDAVVPARKAEARELTMPLFALAPPWPRSVLRVNNLRTPDGLRDILAVLELPAPPEAVMLPKVDSAAEVRWADELLARARRPLELYAIIESAEGLAAVHDIAAATPRLTTLLFGAVDLSASLGCENRWESLLYARGRVAHAAARSGIEVMDVPHLDLDDEAGLRHDAAAAKALGFSGKAAIHPRQIPIIHEAFTPTAAAIAQAQRVLAAFAADPTGLVVVDGRLIEKPVIRAMERTVALAKAAGAL